MAIDKKQLSETDIRTKYITPAIEAAGWNKMTQMREKYPITAGRIIARGQVCKREKPLKADYVLFYKPNKPIAIVEAKDNNHTMSDGMQQALNYARMMNVPFVFSSNGDGFVFHNRYITEGEKETVGDSVGDGGEYGFGFTINPDLPPSELGAQIVEAAKKYIGRSYSSMDCSKLARTAYSDCGLSSMNGLSSVYMAKKCEEMGCLFTDPSQLQAGDLIFFSRFDPNKGSEYCGDVNRCGTGKCKRWMHIHHVAIYINDEFLIDSTGGKNSVQIRKHWGIDTAEWKWVCFGRPTS